MKNKPARIFFMISSVFLLILITDCKNNDYNIAYGIPLEDIDGNIYQTVTIGSQTWMAENLKTTKYRNGDMITQVQDSASWRNYSKDAFCNYKNESNNAIVYGRLYNWNAVINSKGLCPEGWHVPTFKEWETLVNYLGGYTWAGGKLKESGTRHWIEPNEGATNLSKFSALPGGMRESFGPFNNLGSNGVWWTSSPHSELSLYVVMETRHPGVMWIGSSGNLGLSVRCIKDSTLH